MQDINLYISCMLSKCSTISAKYPFGVKMNNEYNTNMCQNELLSFNKHSDYIIGIFTNLCLCFMP